MTGIRIALAATGAILLIILLMTTSAVAQTTVSISTWQSSNGTGVRFDLTGVVTGEEPKDGLTNVTSGDGFDYAVDKPALLWGSDCTCYRHYVIWVRSRATSEWMKYKFKGTPSGSFDDQRVKVRLVIQAGTQTLTDDITLPVASAPGLELCPIDVKTERNLESVALGGVTEIQLTLTNTNSQMTIEIPTEIVVTEPKPQLWKAAEVTGAKYPITLDPLKTKMLTLRLEPHAGRAIDTAFRPTGANTPHTSVRLEVPYANTLFPERGSSVTHPVELRFQPGVVALALWLTGGVILGSLVPLAVGGIASLKRWPRAALAALVAGTIFELFGILAVQNDSKFVLFGFDLNPWQSLPVLLLGVLMGVLGLGAARYLQDFINKKRE